jgi:two-component system, chemotaxis family, sensor kinase CheA
VDPSQLLRAPGASAAGTALLERRGEAVPLLVLAELFRLAASEDGGRKALVIRRNGQAIAFAIDRMVAQQEVVVRPLEDPLVKVPGVSGATDLGDGRPTLVLDLSSLSAVAAHEVLS